MNRFTAAWLAREQDYVQTVNEAILPYNRARRTDETVAGGGGVPIFTSRYLPDGTARGTVLMIHGFTESGDKFAELIFSLLHHGLAVVTLDHRGHGRSWHPAGVDHPSTTHVDRFDDYVEDLRQVIERIVLPLPAPRMLFAHSMGGAIAARYLEEHDGVFERAVLSSPMIAPNTGGIPPWVTGLICRAATLLGRGRRHVFVAHPYAGPEDFATSAASSAERFAWWDGVKAAHAEYQNACPSYGWTLESVKVTRTLLRPGAVERIRIPVRLYTAENDASVLPEPQRRFAARLPHGEQILVRGARHEIYRSPDEVMGPWWDGVLAFLLEACGSPEQTD